jgi:hypothetical protein
MKIIANIVGIVAVIMFVLSYQFKTRKKIIFFNGASRVLYVLQYVLLFAFEGAVMDVVALIVTVLAERKDTKLLSKHKKLLIIICNLFIVGVGLLLYKNIFSLLPIFGVLFETGALWFKKEKHIRILSFFGAPFWFAYNLVCGAYGSLIGNVMTMVSIGLAIFRYDIKKGK